MAFQLIIDNRVAKTTVSLQDSVREAAKIMQNRPKSKAEIVDLSGSIYSNEHVVNLVESLVDKHAAKRD